MAIITFLIMPIPILFLLILTGIFFLFIKRKRTFRVFLVLSGGWLLIITTPFIPKLMVRSLEKKYSPLTDTFQFDSVKSLNIFVLAAGHADDPSLNPNDQLSRSALGRLTEGVRLQKIFKNSKLILSGPGGVKSITQAEVLFRTAIIMGVDSSSMEFFDKSKSTRDEAEEYFQKFGKSDRLILVTSAIHMPRAMMIFRKMELDPVAAPTNHLVKYGSEKSPFWWMPSGENVEMMEAATHEYVGLLWAKLGGK